MMRAVILTFLLVLLNNAAFAQTPYDDANFKDWLTVTDLLRTKGVVASQVNWTQIEPMCLPLQKPDDQIAYNRCRYQKALDSRLFSLDHKSCKTGGDAEFPNSLLQPQVIRTYIQTNPDGTQRTAQEFGPPVYGSRMQLDDARLNYFNNCMALRNWINPQSWMDGRREATPAPIVP